MILFVAMWKTLWGVTSRWFLEPSPKGNQSIDGDTGRRCWACSSLCSILRLTSLERAPKKERSDGRWWNGFLVALQNALKRGCIPGYRLSDYQYVLVWVAEVIFVVIFYEATLFNGILCEVDAGGLSLRKGYEQDELNNHRCTQKQWTWSQYNVRLENRLRFRIHKNTKKLGDLRVSKSLRNRKDLRELKCQRPRWCPRCPSAARDHWDTQWNPCRTSRRLKCQT